MKVENINTTAMRAAVEAMVGKETAGTIEVLYVLLNDAMGAGYEHGYRQAVEDCEDTYEAPKVNAQVEGFSFDGIPVSHRDDKGLGDFVEGFDAGWDAGFNHGYDRGYENGELEADVYLQADEQPSDEAYENLLRLREEGYFDEYDGVEESDKYIRELQEEYEREISRVDKLTYLDGHNDGYEEGYDDGVNDRHYNNGVTYDPL
jgi:hypothetical protein